MPVALAGVARNLLGLLWPDTCAACGTNLPAAQGFCADCAAKLLPLVAGGYCLRCGTSLGPGIAAGQDGCMACPQPMPRFERLVRLGPYSGPLRMAVHRLKYSRRPRAAGYLEQLLAESVAAKFADVRFDLVMPVPMHWLRRLARGWNHSATLAMAIAARLNVPMGSELVRVRNTPPQVRLPASRRVENIRGAFAVLRPAALEGRTICLVDDVTTTGSTCNEAARTLLSAGVHRVLVAVLAKADPPRAYSHQLSAAR